MYWLIFYECRSFRVCCICVQLLLLLVHSCQWVCRHITAWIDVNIPVVRRAGASFRRGLGVYGPPKFFKWNFLAQLYTKAENGQPTVKCRFLKTENAPKPHFRGSVRLPLGELTPFSRWEATCCPRTPPPALCSLVLGHLAQSCLWAGLGRDFSVFGGLGWVHYSKSTEIWKDYVNAFEARLDKIWLHLVVLGWVGLGPNFSTCSVLGWIGSVSWWVGLDRVTRNRPMDNSGLAIPQPLIEMTSLCVTQPIAGHILPVFEKTCA